MRAVSKADYGKGGNIPSYEVLKVFTDGGVWKVDEMYFYDYDEDRSIYVGRNEEQTLPRVR